jgi:iron complex transport system ATP-binding protein
MSELLRASDLNFAYGDRPVLSGVSLSVRAGEVVALLGPNGSGKSTLIKVLLGQLRAQGSILWDERPLGQWTRRELARKVAYLPQAPTCEPDHRVIEVLRLGRAPYWRAFGIESSRDAEVVAQVAHTLDLSDLLDRRMDRLSGGQRQRVFLGRSLVQEPAALLLDEPATFLDLKHQVELGKRLRQLAAARSIGVLMASHDINLSAAFSHRVVLLKDGTVAAEGSPTAVLQPQVISDVYGVAMERVDREGRVPMVFPSEA